MSSNVAIFANRLSKTYPIYEKPHHRLLHLLSPSTGSRWYKEFRALQNINLEIFRGETVGIVGRNGSGKSTLLQLICGTLTPTQGDVQVNGRIAALLELGAGFNPEFTGRENVFIYGAVLGLKKTEIEKRFEEIVSFAEIEEFIDQPVKNYSSGMYVRLAFAVAVSVMPDILIVDEALSVGDEAFQRKCFARIDQIRQAGATILFVSHSAGTVIDLCDRAVLLDHGELLAVGKPKVVVSFYQKLLYAPPERIKRIRAELQNGFETMAIDAEYSRNSALDATQAEISTSQSKELQAYWDEGLVPSSTLNYENKGAQIDDPHIETLAGQRVNVLAPGKDYVYTYRVRVDRALTRVRCGMMIKSLTGNDIAGMVTASQQDAIPIAECGVVLTVRFRFHCSLASGPYFLNAGILALDGQEEIYIDRRIDVAMFRVMHDPSRLATGYVDLDFSPDIGIAAHE